MQTHYRTHLSRDLSDACLDQEIRLSGWVHRIRDLGQVAFMDLRDHTGLFQVVLETDGLAQNPEWRQLRSEYVITVTGTLRKRGTANPDLHNGHLELCASKIQVLNVALTPPIPIHEHNQADELTRMKYRYLDLRRPEQSKFLILRHQVTQAIRGYLNTAGFVDVETPYLTKSTPEGARDYVVPSRVHPGKFFALPQSPQLFKQLLMMSGMDRYYQIVRCFRDEDLRSDRQPEFTQVDIEASFVTRDSIITLITGLMKDAFAAANKTFPETVPLMSYQEAYTRYGSDRPDLRYDLSFHRLAPVFATSTFQAFTQILADNGHILGFKVTGKSDSFSRKFNDGMLSWIAHLGFKGIAVGQWKEDTLHSSFSKFLSPEHIATLQETLSLDNGDTVVILAHPQETTIYTAMDLLRRKLAETLNLYEREDAFVWVIDFPMFAMEETGELAAMHHPFTAPHPEDIALLDTAPEKVRAQAYDIVWNGIEIGGGSIRIHDSALQQRIFEALGLSASDISDKFGFFVDALQYGTPPHGGIALGLDRLIMMLAGTTSIRDVIAFPKTAQAQCPLSEAPSTIHSNQLNELKIRLDNKDA
jgi:aspartyl-tRNA synthetase